MPLVHECVQNIEGLAAAAGAVVLIWWKIHVESRKWKAIYDVSVAGILKSIRLNINSVVQKSEPDKIHTLGIQFEGGIYISIPVIIGTSYCPWPGLTLTGIRSTRDMTNYSLETSQATTLVRHQHDGYEERVTVVDGSMTDLDHGVVFHAGETWTIAPGSPHRVYFEAHGLFMCELVPALPLAKDKPVNVDRLHELEMLT